MRPTIKSKIAFFYPTGFLDGESAKELITSPDVDYIIDSKPEGAFISLKKVVFFNKRGISILIESLSRAREKVGTIIGFCDYDVKKFKMMVDMFPDGLFFSLFDTADITILFLGDDLSKVKEKKIFIYSDKAEQKNQLAMELYERGLAPVVAKNEEEYKSKRKDFDYVIANAYLGNIDKTPTVFIKENVIVYTLKSFVDSDMSKRFDMVYHTHCLRVGFKCFLFDATEVSSINVHGVNFIAKLSTAGAEYGATIIITGLNKRKITDKLSNDLEDAGVMVYENMGALFADEEMMKEASSVGGVAKKHGGITRELVEFLPTIISSTLKTVEVLSGYNTSKKSITVHPLELNKDLHIKSASIAFYGDLNGVLLIIFEEHIAKDVCKVLLEEGSDDSELLDAVGELVHILGSKMSQQLLKKGKRIDITMPRTFDRVDDILQAQQGIKGAQVDFIANDQPLSIFLTR